ncbi:hypothetical protein EYF80_049856 [Liparis tanakae]|uniref:Uncharacterized protein n=1 Tax=Liparis tanakae TaxID=230148 RepID=A0A4Z2FGF3_9TELE|nr:hypothetical protein EYF80_049856 [Liparis tanakae]
MPLRHITSDTMHPSPAVNTVLSNKALPRVQLSGFTSPSGLRGTEGSFIVTAGGDMLCAAFLEAELIGPGDQKPLLCELVDFCVIGCRTEGLVQMCLVSSWKSSWQGRNWGYWSSPSRMLTVMLVLVLKCWAVLIS